MAAASPGPAQSERGIISLRGITKRFGEHQVLEGIDLDIKAGETHVVLGRSGSGKSVMLKLICGLMLPDAGEIMIDGQIMVPATSATSRREALSKIQMLFQGGALFDSMTVAQNIAFHAIEHGRIKPAEAESFARKYLDAVNMPRVGRRMPASCPAGCASGRPWHGHWPPCPRSCSMMSRRRDWIHSPPR
jgi:phospholipid/cholesterol/gamma-HCH transport system ATP-binding protein